MLSGRILEVVIQISRVPKLCPRVRVCVPVAAVQHSVVLDNIYDIHLNGHHKHVFQHRHPYHCCCSEFKNSLRDI